jgi:YcxB-like protein
MRLKLEFDLTKQDLEQFNEEFVVMPNHNLPKVINTTILFNILMAITMIIYLNISNNEMIKKFMIAFLFILPIVSVLFIVRLMKTIGNKSKEPTIREDYKKHIELEFLENKIIEKKDGKLKLYRYDEVTKVEDKEHYLFIHFKNLVVIPIPKTSFNSHGESKRLISFIHNHKK